MAVSRGAVEGGLDGGASLIGGRVGKLEWRQNDFGVYTWSAGDGDGGCCKHD